MKIKKSKGNKNGSVAVIPESELDPETQEALNQIRLKEIAEREAEKKAKTEEFPVKRI